MGEKRTCPTQPPALAMTLSYINRIIEYPAAFSAEIISPCFDTVDTRLCGDVGADLLILPRADQFSVFDETYFRRRRQARLHGHAAFGWEFITHLQQPAPYFIRKRGYGGN